MVKEYTVISLFAGCGGSSLGYKWAGFKELLAIEWDSNAVETFKLNFPEIPVWQRDIKTVQAKEIREFLNIGIGDLDLLDGSPPCQGFSTAGKRIVSDERNDLFQEYARLVNDLQPKVFVMENVSGMIKGTMKGKFIEIMQVLKSMNYNVKAKLMNAMYYNVPQSRQRMIFIGVRKDLNIEPSFPLPNSKVITVREAWKGIKNKTFVRPLGKVGGKVWENIKQGENGSAYRANYYFNTTKLKLDKYSPTIIKNISGVGGMFHPTEKRTITIEELKRLCSFPDNFILTGSVTNQWARIGNAVMPKFMQVIAENIKENILNKSLFNS